MGHRTICNRNILTRNPFLGILGSGLNGNAVIPDVNAAVANAHTRAGLRIDPIRIRRIRRIHNRNIVHRNIAALYGINRPAGRILQRDVLNRYPCTAVEADQLGTGILQLLAAVPEDIPPWCSVAFKGSAAGYRDINKVAAVNT
ncbi:hypothetical protein D3C80_1673650 [compost metagenome]